MNAEAPTPASTSLPSWALLGDGRIVKSQVYSPLFAILTQINIAAQNGLDLLAISMAVALPDICASLMSGDGRTNGNKYKEWCRNNLKDGFDYVSPQDLYSMRCGVLHNGRCGDLTHSVSRIVFIPGPPVIGQGLTDDAFIYSTIAFCMHMNRAVVAWYEANQNHPNVQANISRLMQYHEGGLYPYVVGVTVVA